MVEDDIIWTDLVAGKKIIKDDIRVELCGDIDEANSALGMARATAKSGLVSEIIYKIQKELFIVGAECATLTVDLDKLPRRISNRHIESLRRLYEEIKGYVAPLRGFVTPGDSFASANIHLARTIIRRAERRAVKMRREGLLGERVVRYLNVLSDLLFYLAVFEDKCRSHPGNALHHQKRHFSLGHPPENSEST